MADSRTAVEPGQEFIKPDGGVPMPGPIPYPPPYDPPLPPPPKPGWQTTEFWINVFVQIVAMLSAAGVLSSDEAGQWQSVAVIAGGLIASVISSVMYTKSRTTAKTCGCG
jgi:hypothetical protein